VIRELLLFGYVILAILAVAGVVSGIGLLYGQPWSRFLTMVIAVSQLSGVPIGTALGVYALIVMFKEETVWRLNGTPLL
jgi:hypothetical protein